MRSKNFKKLADKKKDMYDGDIEALIMNVDNTSAGPWILKSMTVNSATDADASAEVHLLDEAGAEHTASSTASGHVEAAFRALEKLTGVDLTLINFELHSRDGRRTTHKGEVTVTVEHNEQPYRGHGTSIDIVEAGSRAYLEVINRILRRRARGLDTAPPPTDINRASI